MSDDLLDRRVQLFLSEQSLIRMMRLPEGSRIRYVQADNDPPGFRIGVLHPDLPLQNPDVEAPIVWGHATVDAQVIDGEIWEKAQVTFPLLGVDSDLS